MQIDDDTLRLLTAAIPRPVLHEGETALATLEAELAGIAGLDLSSPAGHERILAAARECLRRGTRWTSRNPSRPDLPASRPPTTAGVRGRTTGARTRTRTAEALARLDARIAHHRRHLRRASGDALEPFTGWAVWPEDGLFMIARKDWSVTRKGVLVDSSMGITRITGIAGIADIPSVMPWCAFVGLPVEEFEAAMWAQPEGNHLTLTMLDRLRASIQDKAGPGSLLARYQETQAGRAAVRAHGRPRRT